MTIAQTQKEEAIDELLHQTSLGGANIVKQYLIAGLLDDIQIHLVSVLPGEGLRLFEHIGTGQIQLERIKVIESPTRTDLRFRVVK